MTTLAPVSAIARLKHEGPARVLRHISRLARCYQQIQEQVNYLQKRSELMDYPTYQQQDWPIGSGSAESGYRVVMQARLKGPGMHWRPEHINPMLALRLALLNGRWLGSWQEQQRLRQHHLERRTRQQQRFLEHQAKRQEAHPPLSPPPSTPQPTRQKTGRTQAQSRWGRHTFSPRMLQQAGSAKKMNRTPCLELVERTFKMCYTCQKREQALQGRICMCLAPDEE